MVVASGSAVGSQGDVYVAPLADISAAMAVSGLDGVLRLPSFADLDQATVEELVAEFGRFAAAVIAPLDRVGDIEGSTLVDGRVRTPTGFRDAYRRYVDAGWSAAGFSGEIGGGNLPRVAAIAMEEILTAANMAFSLCPMLT